MKDKDSKSKWFFGVILVLCWLLIVSLVKDFERVKTGFKRIDEANLKLANEEAKNLALQKKMAYAQSDSYKEKIVREKLNLQKPGEIVVVLPSNAINSKPGDEVETVSEPKKELKNWEKWLKVIQNN
jgi:cell division protein FtsB